MSHEAKEIAGILNSCTDTNLQKFLVRILAAMVTGTMDLKVELVEACRQPDCIPQLMLILEKYGL